jgi:two-component system, LuxR family, sensor kinase FixL
MTLSEIVSRPPTFPRIAAAGLACFFAALLGRILSLPGAMLPVVWPAVGVLVAILSQFPPKRWPAVLLAAGTGILLSDILVGSIETHVSLAFLGVNLTQAALIAWLLHRVVGSPFGVKSAADIGALIVAGLFIGPILAACLGAWLSLWVGGAGDFGYYWQRWWAANSMGVAMFAAPIVLVLSRETTLKLRPLRVLEALLLAAGLIFVSGAIFGAWPGEHTSSLRFPMYVIPFLAWSGIRFGRQGTAWATLCITLFACWATSRQLGWYSFLELPDSTRMAALQGFTLIASMTPLFLATVYDAQARSDRRFRTLVAHSPTVVFETDTKGRCTYVNERWTQLTGRPRNMAMGFEWISAVHDEDRARVVTAWLNMTSRREETPTLECRYYGVNGDAHWVIMNAVAMRAGGEVIGYLGTILDITDRRQAELRLQQSYEELERRVGERTAELTSANGKLRHEIAERIGAEEKLQQQQSQLAHVSRLSTMGQMMAGLAHEVNQPLYAISNYARGMLRRLQTGDRPLEETQEVLEQVAHEAERAGEILRRVRSFARRQNTGLVHTPLQQLIADVVRLTAFEVRQWEVTILLDLSESLLFVHCDPIQIQQVLVNLVRNAIEAMEGLPASERVITINTFELDGEVGCAVSDAGQGISPDDLDHIFDPFFTTKSQGLGMGLPISRSLVEAFSGRLWVEPRLGSGACFCFTLPRTEAEEVGQHERYSTDRVLGG